jgi:hypothetical protein
MPNNADYQLPPSPPSPVGISSTESYFANNSYAIRPLDNPISDGDDTEARLDTGPPAAAENLEHIPRAAGANPVIALDARFASSVNPTNHPPVPRGEEASLGYTSIASRMDQGYLPGPPAMRLPLRLDMHDPGANGSRSSVMPCLEATLYSGPGNTEDNLGDSAAYRVSHVNGWLNSVPVPGHNMPDNDGLKVMQEIDRLQLS